MLRKSIAVFTVLFAALPGCQQAQTTSQNETTEGMSDEFVGTTVAPEFPQGMVFLNTDRPLSMRELQGKIVLLDFWTYCCINCIHILPDLKRLEKEFPELVVIGVHSAKFQNEKDADNIREAVLRYDIEHPVAVDNDFVLWQKYGVNAWPSFALIDPKGKVLGTTSGEGVYEQLQPYIAGMSKEFDKRGLLNKERLDFELERNITAGAPLAYPGKVDADAKSGRLFFTDSNHNRIVVLDLQGNVLQVIGTGAQGTTDGALDAATFFRPQGVAYDAAADVLYVADTENHLIRRVNFKTGMVETILGTGKQATTYTKYANGTADAINSPWDLQLLGGKLYIAMAGPHQLWVLDPATKQAEVYAGSGRENITDGPRLNAALAQPSGLTTNGKDLFFADSEVSAIRTVQGDEVKTLIGEGLFEFGDVDGTYPKARLQHVIGVTWHQGKLYLADTYNHKVRVYDPATGQLSSLLGTGQRGSKDGSAKEAQFSEPNDLIWVNGKLYILDTNNHLIRVYDPATGQVTTLEILQPEKLSLLEAKRTSKAELPFYGETVTLPAAELEPGTTTLHLKFTLPAGYKLNADAPSYLQVIEPKGKSVKLVGVKESITADIQVDVAANVTELTVEAGVYYCQDGREGVCKIKQLRFKVPVRVARGGATKVVLPYAVKQ